MDTFSSDKVQSIPNGIFLYSPQNGRTPSPTPPPPNPCQNTMLTLLDNRNLCDLKSIAQIN